MSETKVAIVTGSSRGIGYEIVKNLCKKFSGVVYLTSRNIQDGNASVENLSKLGLKPEYHQLDVTDDESIALFAKLIKEKHGGMDILVNNAAVACWTNSPAEFVEKAQVCLATNYFGLVTVCKAMFPLLRPHARVVNVSSCEGHLSKIPGQAIRDKLNDPTLTLEGLDHLVNKFLESVKAGTYNETGWGPSPYRVSKASVCAFTFLQQRKFDSDPRADIVLNAVHPGFCSTNITRYRGPLTAQQGADAPTYLALLPPNVTHPKGQFVWKDRSVVSWIEPLKERC